MPMIYGKSKIGNNTDIDINVIIGYPSKDEVKKLDRAKFKKLEGPGIGNNCKVRDFTKFKKLKGAKIGNNCTIRDFTVIYSNVTLKNKVETGHHVLIREYATIKDGTHIGSSTNIDSSKEYKTEIGSNVDIQGMVYIPNGTKIRNNVFIGPRAVFTNDKYIFPDENKILNPVTIEDNVKIGANSTILPGICVGKFAFIGAKAVVTKNVPNYCLVYGNPARVTGLTCKCKGTIGKGKIEGDFLVLRCCKKGCNKVTKVKIKEIEAFNSKRFQ